MPPDEGCQVYSLFGDAAYAQTIHLYGPFRNPAEGSPQAAWNEALASVRIVVEWNFGEVVRYWKYVDHRAEQKVFLIPIAKHYFSAVFLCNLRTCFHSNRIAQHFGAHPMLIDEYLGLIN